MSGERQEPDKNRHYQLKGNIANSSLPLLEAAQRHCKSSIRNQKCVVFTEPTRENEFP